MKKNEKAFVFIIIIGLILKLSLVSIGQWILLIGVGLLANTYFFGFTSLLNNESYQSFSQNRNFLKNKSPHQFLPPYSIVIIIIGMLFKFNAWPGGNMLIATGLSMLIIGLFFIYRTQNDNKAWKMGAYKRMLIFGILGLLFYSLPNFYFFEIINRNHPEYIEATKNFYEDPENESYKLKMDVEREKMENGI